MLGTSREGLILNQAPIRYRVLIVIGVPIGIRMLTQ